MVTQYLKNILLILLLFYSTSSFASSGCKGSFYDLCWQNRCDEYISIDLDKGSSFPYDSTWDEAQRKYKCPAGGCKLCGIDAFGNSSDDCYSPFPIFSQITRGNYALETSTTLLYSTFGYTKSCGPKNSKSMPLVSDAASWLGISMAKKDGFNDTTNKTFRFDKSNNPSGYGSEYVYTKAQQVGPGGYYLLQPRIKTIGTNLVLQFFISQWGWHLSHFVNLDGTYTSDYFGIVGNTTFSTEADFNWDTWRQMIICDDYNDRNNSDGRSSGWMIGDDYNEDDDRYCYIKITTWNKLYEVATNDYWDCDAAGESGLDDIAMFDDNTASDSVRSLKGVCKVNIDEGNARNILSSGIIIPNKAGQYNFLNKTNRFKGGSYSVVTEPIFSVIESAESTFLSPKITLNVSGGNPNATNASDSIAKELGASDFEYQDGFFQYRLSLHVENNDIIGSKPQLCLYGCSLDLYDKCVGEDKTLDDLIINETDDDLVEYYKSKYLIDECIDHKTIDVIDSAQNYNIAITGLGVGSTFADPRMGVIITNSLDINETVTQTFYLRSYENNAGDQEVPYSDIPEYTDTNDIPDYQLDSGDTHDYPAFDFRNTYYIMTYSPEESIFTYLKNNSLKNIVMPFLFNNLIIYDDANVITDESSGSIIAKPCTEFLRSNAGCHFDSSSMDTYCGVNTTSDMCHEDAKYQSFICLHNLYNQFYRFTGSTVEYYSDSLKDPMYVYNNTLITNDYVTYLNSAEYNNLDIQFPSSGNNLCIPNYLYLNTDKGSFNYELNTTGIDTADINIKMTRSDGSTRTFNALDVPDPDFSSTFNYISFTIEDFSVGEKNTYCEASINSNSYDLRYDYYHKYHFKIFNNSGFIYVCYKKYESPSSSTLSTNWDILTAYTNDFYTGNQIYTDFINLNICPAYSGDDIADFLSCPDQGAAHYNPAGEEIWCGCSAATEWDTYTTSEKNASWSNLVAPSGVQVKAKCMMDGSWDMTSSSSYCPVYCNSDETGLNGVTIAKTLAVEGEESTPIAASCLGGLTMTGGSISTTCSGMDTEEGDWTNISGSGACLANCPTAYFNTTNNEVSSSTNYRFQLNAVNNSSSSSTLTVDCAYGYKGTATATCDYVSSTWTNISNTCTTLTCPAGWITSSNTFSYKELTRMHVASGNPNCVGSDDVDYDTYSNLPVKVSLSLSNYDTVVNTSCNSSSVKINGSLASSNPLISNQSITSTCVVSGSGDSASASWNINTSSCKANCITINGDKNDVEYISPAGESDRIFSNEQGCSGSKHRTRFCRGTCINTTGSNKGEWTGVDSWDDGC